MQLSVLDLFCGPADSVELVQRADMLGYHRYWLGEHHTGVQCANPILLGSVLLGLTEQIRLGTGSLSIYACSPYSVGEDLDLIRMLYGDRFDLGVSRGFVGTAAEVRDQLLDGRDMEGLRRNFGSRLAYLRESAALGPEFAQSADGTPRLWLLGVSETTARLAGSLGIGFCSSFYHTPSIDCLEAALAAYRSSFQASDTLHEPYSTLVLSGLCTPTLAEAERELSIVFRGSDSPPFPLREITDRPVGPWLFAGDSAQCRATIEAAIDRFRPDEVMIHNLTPLGPRSLALEMRSLELLAAEFHLGAALLERAESAVGVHE